MAEPSARLLTNVAVLVGARGVSAAVSLITLAVLYRHLGAADFGAWILITAFCALLSLIDLGLGVTTIRAVATHAHDHADDHADDHAHDHAEDPALRRQLAVPIGWALLVGLLTASVLVVGWPVIQMIFRLHQPTGLPVCLIMLAAATTELCSLPWRAVLEGHQRYGRLSAITALGALTLGAVSVLVVLAGGGLVGLALVALSVAIGRAGLLMITARTIAPDLRPRFRGLGPADLWTSGQQGVRIQTTTLSGLVNLETDRFVIGAFFGPSAVAGFELGARWAVLLRLVPGFALTAMFPMAVARVRERGDGWLEHFHRVATRYLAGLAAVGAALLVAGAQPLTTLWLGRPDGLVVATIMILTPAYAINLLSGATSIVCRVRGQAGRETRYAVLSAVVNLALTYPLLRLFGPTGIPAATAVGVVVGTGYFLTGQLGRSARAWAGFLADAGRPMVGAGVGVALAVTLVPVGSDGSTLSLMITLVLRSVVIIAATAVALLASGFLDHEERERLGRLVGRRLGRPSSAAVVAR